MKQGTCCFFGHKETRETEALLDLIIEQIEWGGVTLKI